VSVFFFSSMLLPRPGFGPGAIDALLFWSGCEQLVAAFFFFPRMLSPNPFFIAGSDPTVAFDRENTLDDSVFGCTGSAAGLDNGVGGAVTFISGTMVLLPGVDATADLAVEDDEKWEGLSCNGRSAASFSPPDFVAGDLGDPIGCSGFGANTFACSTIVPQIEEVRVDSCFVLLANNIEALSYDVANGVNDDEDVAGVVITRVPVTGGVVTGARIAADLVTENLEPAVRVFLLGIGGDGYCEAISWNRSYSAYVLPCTDAVLDSSRCRFLNGVVFGI
jgi:hypothetical protein